MIHKFIDDHGTEITVNSLSQLQTLVESKTIKKNTKVKAGLRGEWKKAKDVPELKFEEERKEEKPKELKDIESFVTREAEPAPPPKKETITKTEKPKVHIEEDKIVDTKVDLKFENKQPKERIVKTDDVIVPSVKQPSEVAKVEQSKIEKEELENFYDDDQMEDINFFQSFRICFKKFVDFKGRASRSEYWWFMLFTSIISIPSYLPNETVQVLSGLGSIIILLPTLAVTVRRLHDINKSGWLVLIALIPLIGAIILLVMLIERGTLGKNRFGEYPLKYKNQEKKIDNEQLIIDQTINKKEDKDFFINVLWRGNYSLKQSFWAFYLLPVLVFAFLIFLLMPTVLLPNAYMGVSIIYYLIVFTAIFYSILSMIGTWKSAIKYTNKKKLLNKAYAGAIAAQIFIVLDVVSRIVNIANVLNE